MKIECTKKEWHDLEFMIFNSSISPSTSYDFPLFQSTLRDYKNKIICNIEGKFIDENFDSTKNQE
jgi:hypothetical protein